MLNFYANIFLTFWSFFNFLFLAIYALKAATALTIAA